MFSLNTLDIGINLAIDNIDYVTGIGYVVYIIYDLALWTSPAKFVGTRVPEEVRHN
jgi:hypothetical protein